jgi:acyl transferase domain-containing protein
MMDGGDDLLEGADAVAVIGMACRVPGAANIEELWANLCAGIESISRFSVEELTASGVPPEVSGRKDYVPARGALEGIDLFDAAFFGFSPREAEMLDPQQRLFLECACAALEDAGYDSERFPGAIGLFGGTGFSTYLGNLSTHPELVQAYGPYQTLLANDKDFLASRVAYKLNLRGPCVTVQTACSTSLVAVHLACQSLLNSESDMALAGGVSLSAAERSGYLYEEQGILSPDGHCRAFDARAAGTVGGSGVGIVVLKRLEPAMQEGDNVLAVIRGTAINNDGALKLSFTAPSLKAQAEVVAEALAVARVTPASVGFVEAHGTGTRLGDPVEVAALTRAFAGAAERGSCALGSVKTNLGHLDAAAGVVGLIKTVLTLRHARIPPTLHFMAANPEIDFSASPFFVNREVIDWPRRDGPRRAGVSSLGIGGTNAHAVLEEAPPAQPSTPGWPWCLLPLSARSEPALEVMTDRLADFLAEHPESPREDVAFTLQTGRRVLPVRRIAVVREGEEASRILAERRPGRVFTQTCDKRNRPVFFLLSGQGAQYPGMGRDLYIHAPRFRAEVDRCAELLAPEIGGDLRQVLYPARPGEADSLLRAGLLQPALFAVEYALSQLWISWGVVPRALLGHSLGEVVAACLAGILPLRDALRLVAVRGRLCERLPAGAMLAVPMSPGGLGPRLGASLELAAVNGAELCTVAGPELAIERLRAELESEGHGCRRLHTQHAFHSAAVDSILPDLEREIAGLSPAPPRIPCLSNVLGAWHSAESATDRAYWLRQLRAPVRFSEGLEALFAEPEAVLLEIGPGNALASLARRHPSRAAEQIVLSSLPHGGDSRAEEADLQHVLQSLGHLWMAGVPMDWKGFQHGRRNRVALPTYPFERRRFWIESRREGTPPPPPALPAAAELSGPDAALYVPRWTQSWPVAPGEAGGPWLFLLDDAGLGESLARSLEGAGETVVRASAREGFSWITSASCTFDAGNRGDSLLLLQELAASGRMPRRVVHMLGVTGAAPGAQNPESFAAAQERCFYSLLHLAEALGAVAPGGEVAVTVISDQVQPVTGEEPLAPVKSTLLGPCRVIPQEYPILSCRCVDVTLPRAGSRERELLTGLLLAELRGSATEPVVAYRGNQRWVQQFTPLARQEAPQEAPRLRERGTYVITGGLGRIGLALAEHLVRSCRARLVLTARTPLHPREQWPEVAAGDDPQAARVRAVLSLEELGAEVLVCAADVSDPGRMGSVIGEARERFGEVHGIIHAAGWVRDEWRQPIRGIGRDACEAHFAPKALGAFALAAACGDLPLDFVVLVSSLSTLLGGLGFSAYAAANCFLDVWAHERSRAGGVPWISIDWDAWSFAGEEGTRQTLDSEQGSAVFSRILALPLGPQVVVSVSDLERRLADWVALQERREEILSRHDRPPLTTAYEAPATPMEEVLAALWEELLGCQPVGIRDNFFDLGGHSLLGVRLNARLRQMFSLDLPLATLFENPTIAQLAQACELSLLEQVEQLDDGEAQRLLAARGSADTHHV